GRQTQLIEAFGDDGPAGLQRTTLSEYDAADRLTVVYKPRVYDAQMPVVMGFVATSYAYDPLGRQTTIVEALNAISAQRTTTMAYDAAGNLLAAYKPLAYDLPDRPAVYSQASVPASYTYDWLNRRADVIETAEPGKTRTTHTDYDA